MLATVYILYVIALNNIDIHHLPRDVGNKERSLDIRSGEADAVLGGDRHRGEQQRQSCPQSGRHLSWPAAD